MDFNETEKSAIQITPVKSIEDLLDFAKEHKDLDALQFGISVFRTRPYSRISAILTDTVEDMPTLDDVCRGVLKNAGPEVYDYVRKLNVCAEDRVWIYRGGSEIKPGDWVALEYEYAKSHGEPVYKALVPKRDVVWAGTYEKEWYYVPYEVQQFARNINFSLEEFYNIAKSGRVVPIKYKRTARARKEPSLPLRMIVNRLHGKIIDYGCGRGTDVEWLKARGYDVVGYDPYWPEYNRPELLTDNTYDVVLCFYVLNIVLPGERHRILESIKRILKPGGEAYIAVRDISEKVTGVPYADGVITPAGTFQKMFTPDELEELLRQHFEYVDTLNRKKPLLAVVKKHRRKR